MYSSSYFMLYIFYITTRLAGQLKEKLNSVYHLVCVSTLLSLALFVVICASLVKVTLSWSTPARYRPNRGTTTPRSWTAVFEAKVEFRSTKRKRLQHEWCGGAWWIRATFSVATIRSFSNKSAMCTERREDRGGHVSNRVIGARVRRRMRAQQKRD